MLLDYKNKYTCFRKFRQFCSQAVHVFTGIASPSRQHVLVDLTSPPTADRPVINVLKSSTASPAAPQRNQTSSLPLKIPSTINRPVENTTCGGQQGPREIEFFKVCDADVKACNKKNNDTRRSESKEVSAVPDDDALKSPVPKQKIYFDVSANYSVTLEDRLAGDGQTATVVSDKSSNAGPPLREDLARQLNVSKSKSLSQLFHIR